MPEPIAAKFAQAFVDALTAPDASRSSRPATDGGRQHAAEGGVDAGDGIEKVGHVARRIGLGLD